MPVTLNGGSPSLEPQLRNSHSGIRVRCVCHVQVFATTRVPDKYSTIPRGERVVLRILWCPVLRNMTTELC